MNTAFTYAGVMTAGIVSGFAASAVVEGGDEVVVGLASRFPLEQPPTANTRIPPSARILRLIASGLLSHSRLEIARAGCGDRHRTPPIGALRPARGPATRNC